MQIVNLYLYHKAKGRLEVSKTTYYKNGSTEF